MRYLVVLLPLFALLSACSSKPAAPVAAEPTGALLQSGFLLEPEHQGHLQNGDFAYNPDTARFVDKMVREHGFEREQLHDVLAQTQKLDWVIRLMDKQAPTSGRPSGPNGAWNRYRNQFITPDNVQKGGDLLESI